MDDFIYRLVKFLNYYFLMNFFEKTDSLLITLKKYMPGLYGSKLIYKELLDCIFFE